LWTKSATAALHLTGQHLPLPGELLEVSHSLQSCLQLLQHGLHWRHSTTLQAKDEPALQEVVHKGQKLDLHASHFAKCFKPGRGFAGAEKKSGTPAPMSTWSTKESTSAATMVRPEQ